MPGSRAAWPWFVAPRLHGEDSVSKILSFWSCSSISQPLPSRHAGQVVYRLSKDLCCESINILLLRGRRGLRLVQHLRPSWKDQRTSSQRMMTKKSRSRQTMKNSMRACLLMSAPPSLAAARAQLPAAGAQRSSMRSIPSRSTTCSPQWLLQATLGPSHALHHFLRRGVSPMGIGVSL